MIWDGIDKAGFKFLDHIPAELIKKKNDTELKIELINGSIIQLIGSERLDLIMGTNPIGIVFSEYALQSPLVWEYVRPILTENGGWAIFNSTPRGENHLFDLCEMAKNNPDWFCEVLTVENTGAISLEEVDRERKEGMPEEMIQQEFFCSFNAAAVGNYYGDYIKKAEIEGRITDLPYRSDHLVYTSWDLGLRQSDTMAIWFYQVVGNWINIIDCYQDWGKGMEYYAKLLQGKEYVYGGHFMPHDADHKQKDEKARSVADICRELGIKPITVVPTGPGAVIAGINRVRSLFSMMRFDQVKCREGLKALRNYHRKYDEAKRRYRDEPEHTPESNFADSFRMLAMGYVDKKQKPVTEYSKSVVPINALAGW